MTDLLSLQCQLSPGPQYDLQVERFHLCLDLIYRKDYQALLFVFPPTKSASQVGIRGDTKYWGWIYHSLLSPTSPPQQATFYLFQEELQQLNFSHFPPEN